MWRDEVLKLLYRVNAHLDAAGVGNTPCVRATKYRAKRLMAKFLVHDNLFLLNVDGISLYVRAGMNTLNEYFFRPFEPHTRELFKRAVKPGATVLDIGAQFGCFSLIAAKNAGPTGRVFAFEPVFSNFQILVRNVELNGFSTVIQAEQKAVGDSHKTVSIFVYKESDSHSMYCHPTASVSKTIQVECVGIDEFLKGSPVDVIKMDIEGNEPYALKGMEKTIRQRENLVLLTEFAPAYLRRAGAEPKEYIDQLLTLGFEVRLINESLLCLEPISENVFQHRDPSWYANLYCTMKNPT